MSESDSLNVRLVIYKKIVEGDLSKPILRIED